MKIRYLWCLVPLIAQVLFLTVGPLTQWLSRSPLDNTSPELPADLVPPSASYQMFPRTDALGEASGHSETRTETWKRTQDLSEPAQPIPTKATKAAKKPVPPPDKVEKAVVSEEKYVTTSPNKYHQIAERRESLTFRTDAARMRWFMLCVILLALCILCTFAASTMIWDNCAFFSVKVRWYWIVAVLISSALVATFSPVDQIIGNDQWFVRWTIGQDDRYHGIESLQASLTRITMWPGMVLTAAFGTCLLQAENMSLISSAQRMATARNALNFGAMLLVAYVVQLGLFYLWSMLYVGPEKNLVYDGAMDFAAGLLSMRSLGTTCLLGVTYYATVASIRFQARTFVPAEVRLKPLPEQDQWFQANGLSLTTPEIISRGLAVLGPLLVGSIPELLTKVLAK